MANKRITGLDVLCQCHEGSWKSLSVLAQNLNVTPESLRPVVETLTEHGFLRENNQHYCLTEIGEYRVLKVQFQNIQDYELGLQKLKQLYGDDHDF